MSTNMYVRAIPPIREELYIFARKKLLRCIRIGKTLALLFGSAHYPYHINQYIA